MLFSIGSGNVWGATSTITLTQSNLGLTGSYSSNATATVGGVTFTHTDLMKNSDNIQVKASTGVLYNSTAMPGKITNITITHTGTARETTVYYGTTAQPSTNSNNFSGSCNIDVSGNNTYFKITRGSNAAYWSSIEITYETAPASACTVTFTKTYGSTEAIKEASAGAGVTPPVMSTPCDGWAFQGWSKSESTSPTSTTELTTVTLSGGKYYPTANTTLYPVYTKSGGTVFSKYQLITSASGDLSGKYLLSTGSITATGAVTSSGILPIESLTPGTIQYAEKEFTIVKNGSNSNYFIKFPNGEYLGNKSGDTDLKRNNSTTAPTTDVNHFLWTFSTTAITNVNNSTRDLKYNSGLTTPGIKSYAQTGNSYPRVKLYKRIEDELTYYYSYPTCCTDLGSINGSINLTQGGTSVTVKEWNIVENAGKYTVKCYEYNEGTSDWDLKATQENITDISTGATFSSLTLNAKYKFSVQAIATNPAFCDGEETEVTTIKSTSVTSTPFQLRYAIHIDDGTKSDSGWEDYWLNDDGTVEITLSGPRDYYEFKIKGGWTGWWGQGSPQGRIPASTEWILNGANNVWLQTWIGGTYTFTVDLSETNPKVTITFPPANQAAGKIVYWDASIHGNNWTKLYFRVGTDANANASSDCKTDAQIVPGTDNFYKVTTASFNDMRAWAITNNSGWTGANEKGVYRTVTETAYNITKSTEYQDYVVGDDGVTLVPASTGSGSSNWWDSNCTFYPVTKTDGMLTHNVAITASTPAAGGSVTATYTNTSGTGGQTVTEGNNADLAHRCIMNVVASPNTGYNVATFTKNGSAFAGGNYILTEDVTFAATFSLKTTNVTLNNHEATTAGASSVTATYSQAVPSIAEDLPAKTGYIFGGYWTGENGTGTKYINADGTSANNWSIVDATTTLHAQWTPKRCTVTLTAGTGSNGSAVFDYDATTYVSFSPAVRVGWTCTGYWTGTDGTGTKILNADGTRADNVAGWWVSNKWSVDNTSATLYAGWTNTYGGDEFELVLDLSELSAGKKIIIMNAGHDKALSTTQNANNRGQVLASADGGFTMSGDNNVATLKAATSVQVMTLEATGTSNQYFLNVENGYLYASGQNSNYYLRTGTGQAGDYADQYKFNFSLSDGDFTVKAQSTTTNGYLRHNNVNSLFSCYNTASSQNPVLVYVKRESCDDPVSALSLSASPSAISTATGHNTSTLSVSGGNGNAVTYSVISANKSDATISGTTTKTFSATVAGTYTVQAFQLKNDNICRQIATTDITVTTPVLTTSKNSHTFEKTKTGSSRTTNTVTISGTNLVENVSVTYTGDTEYFTVTPSSISASDAMSSAQALTITYAPTVAGSHSITITISSTGAVDKTVTVNGTAADFFDVTFHISGSADVVRQVESGEKPVLPDNPASCDATSTAFIGWATAPWAGKIASVSGKTIHTSNATMSAVTAATDYYAVWAKEDASANVANAWAVINEDFASASSGNNTTTSGSGTPWTKTSYFDATNVAYQAGGAVRIGSKENEGYIQTNAIPAAAGAKIRIAFKVKGWSDVEGSIKVTSDDAQFSEQTISYTTTMSGSFESKYVDVTVAAGKSNPKIKIATSAKRAFIDDVVISVYYSDYLTTCCENTGLTFGAILSPVTSYEIVRTSSAAATIECNFESSTTTEIKWYKTSRAARTFVTPTGATSSTAPSSQLAEMTIDIANKKLTASSVGVYTITIKQDEATIAGQKYCESFAEVTVTVKVRDRFVDMMNGEAVDAGGNPTITKDDTGGGIYTPTESEFSEDDICKSTRRKLIGWIKESDLNTGYAGRVNDITDMKTDNPATNKVIAPNTQVVATGCTWYAVWADID